MADTTDDSKPDDMDIHCSMYHSSQQVYYSSLPHTHSLVDRPYRKTNKTRFLLSNSIILSGKHTTYLHTRFYFFQELFLCKDIIIYICLHTKKLFPVEHLIHFLSSILNYKISILL